EGRKECSGRRFQRQRNLNKINYSLHDSEGEGSPSFFSLHARHCCAFFSRYRYASSSLHVLMPLLKRSPFTLLEAPDDLEPHEHVFQVRFTKEIFRDYQEYLKRIDFYRKRLWTCKVTGKSNLTYEEALVSEQQASEKAQQFPEELIGPVLRIVQYSMLPLRDLLVTITSKLQGVMVEGLELQGKRDGYVCSCKIIKVLDDKEGKKYEVAWLDKDKKMNESTVVSEGDLIRKRLPYTRDVLKSFIRESTYRNVPWVIHKNLASKYDISTDPPEELKGQVSVQNGWVVSCRKRKKLDVSEEENNEDGEPEKEHINYPIDDLLLQPIDDDVVLAERPSPLRDFRLPMDCVGDLMMVWDFCTSFGRLLKLSPFSLEDFENAIFYKESNITIIVETHSALLNLLIGDEGEYYTTIMKRKRKNKISKITWTEYLCDFLEMINIPVLSTNIGTIKRGHYGLLDVQIKLHILHELVDQAIITNALREKLEENFEKLQELAAEKRGEAIEDGRKRREVKERLKACESSIIESENGHTASNGNHNLQNGNLLEDETSLQDHSFQNGDSKHEDSGLRQTAKQLMEEMEKNREQRKELLEREMEKRFVRTNSLGKDRDYNRYWFFRRDWRLFVESSDNEQWGYFSSREELDDLIASLNPKGIRERALKGQLENLEMQKRAKDEAHKVELDGALVRRSTRVKAPPRENPALAFIKYTNKWKDA
ncbi:hypothetical protein V2J09_019676, partial [Rumex salicifolius]